MTAATQTPLTRPFDGYNARRGLAEDAAMMRVGRGTPMGELLRRYWQPIAYEREVGDLPLKIRILGEDLVLFRNGRGAYGLVEQRCSHRGASLEYGVISEQGLRCAYHGFHYGLDGTILETGAGAPLANGGKICHGAYPLHVFHQLIFAYMGPPEKKPPFWNLDLFHHPHIDVEPGPDRHGDPRLQLDAEFWKTARTPCTPRFCIRSRPVRSAASPMRWASSRSCSGCRTRRHALHRRAPQGRSGVVPRQR